MSILSEILTAVLAGLAYGLSMYAKKVQNGQEFDKVKLMSTLLVSVFVAVSLSLGGVPVNELTWEQRFLAYAGLIPLVENVIKTFIRILHNRAVEHARAGGLSRKH